MLWDILHLPQSKKPHNFSAVHSLIWCIVFVCICIYVHTHTHLYLWLYTETHIHACTHTGVYTKEDSKHSEVYALFRWVSPSLSPVIHRGTVFSAGVVSVKNLKADTENTEVSGDAEWNFSYRNSFAVSPWTTDKVFTDIFTLISVFNSFLVFFAETSL